MRTSIRAVCCVVPVGASCAFVFAAACTWGIYDGSYDGGPAGDGAAQDTASGAAQDAASGAAQDAASGAAQDANALPPNTSVINVPTCSCPNGSMNCPDCPPSGGIAVDGTNVFWTDYPRGNVYRCPVTGCLPMPTQVATAQTSSSVPLAVYSGDFYWGKGHAYVCPGGTCTSPTDLGAIPGALLGVNAGGLYVYYRGLGACPLGGCASGAPRVIAPMSVFSPTGTTLAVFDAQNVYWYDGLGPLGHIAECPLTGCPVSAGGADGGSPSPTTLAAQQRDVMALAVDANNVYWSRIQAGAMTANQNFDIVKCPIAGCGGNPTILASRQANPTAMAVDSTHVYWINWVAGEIRACAVGGCNSAPTLVAHTGNWTSGMALDANYVYWVSGQGFVARAPKPM